MPTGSVFAVETLYASKLALNADIAVMGLWRRCVEAEDPGVIDFGMCMVAEGLEVDEAEPRGVTPRHQPIDVVHQQHQ